MLTYSKMNNNTNRQLTDDEILGLSGSISKTVRDQKMEDQLQKMVKNLKQNTTLQPNAQPNEMYNKQLDKQPQIDVQPQSDVEPQVDAQPQSDVEPQVDAQPQVEETQTPHVNETQPQVDAQPQPDVEPQVDAQPQPDVEPATTKTDAQLETEWKARLTAWLASISPAPTVENPNNINTFFNTYAPNQDGTTQQVLVSKNVRQKNGIGAMQLASYLLWSAYPQLSIYRLIGIFGSIGQTSGISLNQSKGNIKEIKLPEKSKPFVLDSLLYKQCARVGMDPSLYSDYFRFYYIYVFLTRYIDEWLYKWSQQLIAGIQGQAIHLNLVTVERRITIYQDVMTVDIIQQNNEYRLTTDQNKRGHFNYVFHIDLLNNTYTWTVNVGPIDADISLATPYDQPSDRPSESGSSYSSSSVSKPAIIAGITGASVLTIGSLLLSGLIGGQQTRKKMATRYGTKYGTRYGTRYGKNKHLHIRQKQNTRRKQNKRNTRRKQNKRHNRKQKTRR